ncbi:MAG: hypothetical protein IKH45_04370 [Neisseriaceae bacterium]|nr:hypothetical protein [Neisseriaceae bacterium]
MIWNFRLPESTSRAGVVLPVQGWHFPCRGSTFVQGRHFPCRSSTFRADNVLWRAVIYHGVRNLLIVLVD